MAEAYLVRWFRESDLGAYIAGLNVNLYEEYDEARFRWKFRENPFSLGFHSIVVVEEEATGKPVAFNSFLPLKIRSGDEFFTAVQGCDGFVDPGHRRRGLFQRTLEFMSSELAEKGPEFLMGFNFVESATAALKSGSVLVDDVFRWAGVPKALKMGPSSEDDVRLVPCAFEEIDRVYEGWAGESRRLHIHRSPDYVRWRFERNPLMRYDCDLIEVGGSPRGYLVSTVYRDEIGGPKKLQISDYVLLNDDEDVFSVALCRLLSRDIDMDLVETLTMRGGTFNAVFGRLGVQREAEPTYSLIVKPIFQTEIKEGKLLRRGEDVSRPEAWYITPSDIF